MPIWTQQAQVGLRPCFSDKSPGVTDAAGLWPHLKLEGSR